MPETLLPPTLLVVALGLLASLGWGLGDFGGGLMSRRAPVLGVLFTSQLASLSVGIPLLLLTPEPAMRPWDLVLASIAGALGASGLALLYRGLSVGRMTVVMPIAAMLTAALPVVFGFVTEGIPSLFAIAGIVAAATGVVLVSLSPSPPDGRPSGLWYGIVTGLLFGLFPIVMNGISDDVLVTPVVAVRIASIVTAGGLILARRQPWRVPRQLWPMMLGIGLVDMLATAAYLAALNVGPLAIAAILTSLSNVVTVILAALVLRERITPVHAVGILAAGLAVVLIAIG
ncbi:MAG TPA: EamA family transporter [Candidatus Limnocylindrales bacterium]|nr:EamA family transporter [Candidatus Limnocylindrales bacterium]